MEVAQRAVSRCSLERAVRDSTARPWNCAHYPA
jgi:hypothetical protein